MRVTTNTFPNTLLHQLGRLSGRMNTLQQQTATGQRITQPSDDPAAAGRVLNYQSERGYIEQFYRNALRGQDIIAASVSEVRNLLKVSERTAEIITLASEVEGPDAMRAYGTELDAMIEQGLVNANANFDDEPLFGGTGAALRPFVATRNASGQITSISYAGSTQTAQIQVAEGSRISPYPSYTDNQNVLTFLNNLISVRNALNTGVAANAKALAATMETSEDTLVNMLSAQGALQGRLELEAAQNSARYSNLAEQISREADVDLAQAVVQLTQNQNAYQAALMSAGRIMERSLLDYL